MRRVISSIAAAALLLLTAPAAAEPSPTARVEPPARARTPAPSGPSVAEVERLLGEIGSWAVEYNALMTEAGAVMDEVDAYTAILDRFANREIREREALRQMEAWRANAVARAQRLRANAVALRRPPSLAAMGAEGVALQGALELSHADMPALIDGIIASLEAFAALGVEAIRSPTKTSDARRRAVFTSSAQLVRIDARRIAAASAGLPRDHPNRFIMDATVAYYAAIEALPSHELRILDGASSDPAAVSAQLRQSAQEMRAALAQAGVHSERLARQVRDQRAPPEAQRIQRIVTQIVDTFPETVRLYGELVATLDAAAARIEGGGEVMDAWVAQEEAALAIFDRIARLEDQRARLAAELR